MRSGMLVLLGLIMGAIVFGSTSQSTSAMLTLEELEDRLEELETLLASARIETGTINGLAGPHLIFEGINLHIQDGSGVTIVEPPTGLGNLVVGYNEEPPSLLAGERSGSNNLIVGSLHRYSHAGGFVAGTWNTISERFATVTGGRSNTASGRQSTVCGGNQNLASSQECSVSGGAANEATDFWATVGGGHSNKATGRFSSVSGGALNEATGSQSSVSGGMSNTSSGGESSVTGGIGNEASGNQSVVSGGGGRTASGVDDWVAGSCFICDN